VAANAQFEHANVRVDEPLDRFLRLFVVTPNLHKLHHSRVQQETDSNYANIFSVWDRLIGTYAARADFETLRYVLDDLDERSTKKTAEPAGDVVYGLAIRVTV
jgi:sterol desaturase/sphingolipid hydroxylase (fatty acid hydroxylase superfamily)